MERLRQLIHEIHRRSLWQVLGIYLVASWAVLQVVDTLGGALNLPDWFPSFALALLIVGLPVVLATAFVQEGISKDDDAPGEVASQGAAARSGLFTWRRAITGGVLAFALWGIVAAGWLFLDPSPPRDSIERSIAVLPFDDLSPEGDQRYFAEGLSDEIINALGRIGDLKVSDRTSTFLLAERGIDIRTLANTLGVANVVEGSVRKSGDRVRINAQLIEAESGFQLWSETFERELSDIFAIQDQIARAIVDRLQVTLSGDVEPALVVEATGSLEAYDHYLRGRQLLYQRTSEGLRAAIEAFTRALDADPGYADPHAGLAEAYGFALPYGATPVDSTYAWAGLAIAHAERAVELDSLSAAAFSVRGVNTTAFTWALSDGAEGAEQDYLRALDLQPSSATALSWYAQYLSSRGRHEEALAMHERVLRLDPVSPGRRAGVVTSAIFAEEYELALEQVRRAREIQPEIGGIVTVLELLALVFLERAEACPEVTAPALGYQAMCLHGQGRVAEAELLIDSLAQAWTPSKPWLEADGLVAYHAWTGQVDRALEWVERGLGASPYLFASQLLPGIWEPAMARDEARVRSSVQRLVADAWERVQQESKRVDLP